MSFTPSPCTSYNNSTTLAQNGAINYNVGGNMTGAGYNAVAEDINAIVDGALNLESLQDTYYARGNSFGISGGAGWGSNTEGNANAGKNRVSGGWW
ncbi:hypothetical protein Dip510_001871 [Elusimicrobium posterum]|uniref:hemagglutinin repeat-containing protein n=1 Tax=Elusimicrobium posterum TaxID=3116653 RepID=UPI003C715375